MKQVHPLAAFNGIRDCGLRREELCQELEVPVPVGKQMLITTLNGASVPPRFCGNAFLQNLRKEGRLARRIACNQRPELHNIFRADNEKRWPEVCGVNT